MSKSKAKKKAKKGKVHKGRFVKGHSKPGPGRPKLKPIERLLRGKHKEEFLGYLAEFFEMTVAEVEVLSGDKSLPIGKMMFARWYANRLRKPSNDDMDQLRKWLGISNPVTKIDHTSSDGTMSPATNITPEQERNILEARLETMNSEDESS